jgi:hypothetical protein
MNAGMWVFFGFGVVATLAGGVLLVSRIRARLFGAVAEGTVVDQVISTVANYRGQGASAKSLYAPIVEFNDGTRDYRFTSTLALAKPWQYGSKVVVRFIQGNPEYTAEIGTGLRMFGTPLAMLFAGLVFISVTYYVSRDVAGAG